MISKHFSTWDSGLRWCGRKTLHVTSRWELSYYPNAIGSNSIRLYSIFIYIYNLHMIVWIEFRSKFKYANHHIYMDVLDNLTKDYPFGRVCLIIISVYFTYYYLQFIFFFFFEKNVNHTKKYYYFEFLFSFLQERWTTRSITILNSFYFFSQRQYTWKIRYEKPTPNKDV